MLVPMLDVIEGGMAAISEGVETLLGPAEVNRPWQRKFAPLKLPLCARPLERSVHRGLSMRRGATSNCASAPVSTGDQRFIAAP
jgi:hypothetical protein